MSVSARDDGVVKYHAIHQNSRPLPRILLEELDGIRTKLFDLGLVGIYADGVGYGNVSIRHEDGCIISGTATGSVRVLGAEGYCYVQSFNLQQNTIFTKGPVNASSESMTHCAIYQANALVKCVLHIHHFLLWKKLLDQGCQSTPANISYGTPQMALSVASKVNNDPKLSNLLVMAGHEEGIVAYGQSVSLAFDQINAVFHC